MWINFTPDLNPRQIRWLLSKWLEIIELKGSSGLPVYPGDYMNIVLNMYVMKMKMKMLYINTSQARKFDYVFNFQTLN